MCYSQDVSAVEVQSPSTLCDLAMVRIAIVAVACTLDLYMLTSSDSAPSRIC